MTFDDKARKKILLCSIVLFMISVTYRILNPFVQPTVKELSYKGGQSINPSADCSAIKGKTVKGKDDHSLGLFTELFFTPALYPSGVINDLFQNTPSPLSNLAAIPVPEEDSSESEASIQEELAPGPGEETLAGIVNELMNLKVLGLCKKENKLSFFIKDADNLLVVVKGDKIKGLYPVTELTQEYILIRIPEFHEDVRINLKDFNENRYL